MLNEGVHVNDIDGVIMLRPTNSPIIYTQQLGRALSVGHKEHPIVFDIVNNINSHKIIYDVYQEVKEKLSDKQRNRNGKKVNLADFKIIDELKEPSDFIEALDNLLDRETINGSNFEALIEFIRTYDGQLPSQHSKDVNERRLYYFYNDHKNDFNKEQKQRLNEVMVSKFDRIFEALIESIRNRDGQLPSQYSNNEKEQRLYDFYRRYRNNFNEEQKQRLNEVMVSYFDRMFETLIEFIKTHDGQLPKHSLQNENERKLYKFYIRNKNNFNKEQRQQLNEVMVSKFDRMFETLIEFIRTHDSHLPSAYSDDKNEQRLYSFYKRYRNTFNEKQNQLLITTGLPSKKLEKKTKCIITSQYCKCVLKQRQKDNLQNYHINNQTANNEKSI